MLFEFGDDLVWVVVFFDDGGVLIGIGGCGWVV